VRIVLLPLSLLYWTTTLVPLLPTPLLPTPLLPTPAPNAVNFITPAPSSAPSDGDDDNDDGPFYGDDDTSAPTLGPRTDDVDDNISNDFLNITGLQEMDDGVTPSNEDVDRQGVPGSVGIPGLPGLTDDDQTISNDPPSLDG
jgi:hypothetical protein